MMGQEINSQISGDSMAGKQLPSTLCNEAVEALDAAGGPELVSRYAGSKKAELASAAERIFSGNFIGEADIKERAQAWVPSIMRFADTEDVALADAEAHEPVREDTIDELAEQAA